MKKRILSLVLALCMMIPMLAIAETEDTVETVELIELPEAAAEDSVTESDDLPEDNTVADPADTESDIFPEKMVIMRGEAEADGTEVMEMGAEMNLVAELYPEGATADDFSWKSSKAKVAAVEEGAQDDSVGIVTAGVEGTASITCTATFTNAKGKKATISRTVKIRVIDPKKPDSVKISGENVTTDGKLTVYLNDDSTDGYEIVEASVAPDTADTEDVKCTWKSSSSNVVTVDVNPDNDRQAAISGVREGNAVITCTATYTDANGKKTTKSRPVKVTVVDPMKPTALKLESDKDTVEIAVSEESEGLKITAQIDPADAEDEVAFDWKSSGEKTAFVYQSEEDPTVAYVQGLREGNVTITCTATYVSPYTGKKTTVKAAKKITVVDTQRPTDVMIEGESFTVEVGKDMKYSAVLTPCDTAKADISWKSSNKAIAYIDDDPDETEDTSSVTVHGINDGVAYLYCTATYSASGRTTTVTTKVKITVVDPLKPTGVTIDAEADTVSTLDEYGLAVSAHIAPDTADTKNVTYKWTTSDKKVAVVMPSSDDATVPDADVFGIASGNAIITCTATYTNPESGKKSTVRNTYKITVEDPNLPAGIYLVDDDGERTTAGSVEVGGTVSLGLKTDPVTVDPTLVSVTWTSSRSKVAKVEGDKEGCTVTALQAGTATITCTMKYVDANKKTTTVKATYKVTVTK